ncbi:hypothetical protein PV417_17185 [Streptomyces sp. ME19-03-3]|nr:hypothetical protein [Streptomyces sp. ME19-03-3]
MPIPLLRGVLEQPSLPLHALPEDNRGKSCDELREFLVALSS